MPSYWSKRMSVRKRNVASLRWHWVRRNGLADESMFDEMRMMFEGERDRTGTKRTTVTLSLAWPTIIPEEWEKVWWGWEWHEWVRGKNCYVWRESSFVSDRGARNVRAKIILFHVVRYKLLHYSITQSRVGFLIEDAALAFAHPSTF